MDIRKVQVFVGWTISVLLSAMLGMSAYFKFSPSSEMGEMLAHIGYTAEAMFPLGVIEIACFLLFLLPQTSFIGAILLTGYLGGAISAHYRINDSVMVPVIMALLVWVGYALRRPDVVKKAIAPLRAP
jgi:hypothetical protein